jgi:hypothetical protein
MHDILISLPCVRKKRTKFLILSNCISEERRFMGKILCHALWKRRTAKSLTHGKCGFSGSDRSCNKWDPSLVDHYAIMDIIIAPRSCNKSWHLYFGTLLTHLSARWLLRGHITIITVCQNCCWRGSIWLVVIQSLMREASPPICYSFHLKKKGVFNFCWSLLIIRLIQNKFKNIIYFVVTCLIMVYICSVS